jgi:hypothetical protein
MPQTAQKELTMKPKKTAQYHHEYNSDFPEKFKWNLMDSYKLIDVSEKIAEEIKRDLKTDDRNFTPGLRRALNIIAEHSEIE